MKAPWPKLSTSIKPKTSVKPEAIVNSIRPIARLATVKVTKVEVEPINGAATSAMTNGSSAGAKSILGRGSAAPASVALIDGRPAKGLGDDSAAPYRPLALTSRLDGRSGQCP